MQEPLKELFCFGEALRKGSREAQMARQKMTNEGSHGKEARKGQREGEQRRKEKKKKYISVRKRKVSITHTWNITACLLI